jgi:hypothetical protein
MDLASLEEPVSAYWYAFGRIAEQYGLRETALADYAKVTKPKETVQIPDSTYRLAEIRVQEMNRAGGQHTRTAKKQ